MPPRNKKPRDVLDRYYTPQWMARAGAQLALPWIRALHRSPGQWALEPSAGGGALVDALLELDVPLQRIVAVELDWRAHLRLQGRLPGLALHQGDYLDWTYPDGPGPLLVLDNPPFRGAEAHVDKHLRWVSPVGVVLVLQRVNWLASQERETFWREHPAEVFVAGTRPSFTGDGKTDGQEYAWFRFRPDTQPGTACRWYRLPPAGM